MDRKARYLENHPTAADVHLAIEVSYSSLRTDLNTKAELYAEAGISEYWLVDAVASCVHVFQQPLPAGYQARQIANRGDVLSPQCQPNTFLDIADLFGAN